MLNVNVLISIMGGGEWHTHTHIHSHLHKLHPLDGLPVLDGVVRGEVASPACHLWSSWTLGSRSLHHRHRSLLGSRGLLVARSPFWGRPFSSSHFSHHWDCVASVTFICNKYFTCISNILVADFFYPFISICLANVSWFAGPRRWHRLASYLIGSFQVWRNLKKKIESQFYSPLN